MPECRCPEELGGAGYFEPVTGEVSDWSPTLEHFPLSKKDGRHRKVDNAILAHRLCNRTDYSIRVGREHARDLERIRKPARRRSAATMNDRRSPPDLLAKANMGRFSTSEVATASARD
jgi:hypothetical protein